MISGVTSGWNWTPRLRPIDEGLRADARSRRELALPAGRERVEVPLEPGAVGDEVGLVRADRKPADLLLLGPEDLPAEHAGQELTAEADAEEGTSASAASCRKSISCVIHSMSSS